MISKLIARLTFSQVQIAFLLIGLSSPSLVQAYSQEVEYLLNPANQTHPGYKATLNKFVLRHREGQTEILYDKSNELSFNFLSAIRSRNVQVEAALKNRDARLGNAGTFEFFNSNAEADYERANSAVAATRNAFSQNRPGIHKILRIEADIEALRAVLSSPTITRLPYYKELILNLAESISRNTLRTDPRIELFLDLFHSAAETDAKLTDPALLKDVFFTGFQGGSSELVSLALEQLARSSSLESTDMKLRLSKYLLKTDFKKTRVYGDPTSTLHYDLPLFSQAISYFTLAEIQSNPSWIKKFREAIFYHVGTISSDSRNFNRQLGALFTLIQTLNQDVQDHLLLHAIVPFWVDRINELREIAHDPRASQGFARQWTLLTEEPRLKMLVSLADIYQNQPGGRFRFMSHLKNFTPKMLSGITEVGVRGLAGEIAAMNKRICAQITEVSSAN